jgi:hypothetical protein
MADQSGQCPGAKGLANLDLAHPVDLGDLIDLRPLGITRVLDFAAIGDALTSGGTAEVVDQESLDDLAAAANEEWADRSRADDPRFRDVVPVYVGSMAARFDDALSNPNSPLFLISDACLHVEHA